MYKILLIPIKGYLGVTMNDVNFAIQIKLTNQTVNNRSIPAIKVMWSLVQINTNALDFDLGGGVFSKIADVIIPWFKNLIVKYLQPYLESVINDQFATAVNNNLKKGNGYLYASQFGVGGYYENMTLDYQLDEPPVINGTLI